MEAAMKNVSFGRAGPLVIALALGAALISCVNPVQAPLDKEAVPKILYPQERVTLWAGKTIDVGTVQRRIVDDKLVITYETREDWAIEEIHLALSDDLADIPVNRKGNPIPGHFPTKESFSPAVTVCGFEFPCDYDPGTLIYIAAHAEVVRRDEAGMVVQRESAWSSYGSSFVEKGNWATYSIYVVQ